MDDQNIGNYLIRTSKDRDCVKEHARELAEFYKALVVVKQFVF